MRTCHGCVGWGYVRCKQCWGRGRSTCSWCHGSGRKTNSRGERSRCSSCHGSGMSRCSWCSGTGRVQCKICRAAGQLKCYLQLTVNWLVHKDEHVVDKTGLKVKAIKKATGHIAVDERQPRLQYLAAFPDSDVSDASRSLIDLHLTSHQMERILEQRHSVKVVPVSVNTYTCGPKSGIFHVYGLDMQVKFENYPSKCEIL